MLNRLRVPAVDYNKEKDRVERVCQDCTCVFYGSSHTLCTRIIKKAFQPSLSHPTLQCLLWTQIMLTVTASVYYTQPHETVYLCVAYFTDRVYWFLPPVADGLRR